MQQQPQPTKPHFTGYYEQVHVGLGKQVDLAQAALEAQERVIEAFVEFDAARRQLRDAVDAAKAAARAAKDAAEKLDGAAPEDVWEFTDFTDALEDQRS